MRPCLGSVTADAPSQVTCSARSTAFSEGKEHGATQRSVLPPPVSPGMWEQLKPGRLGREGGGWLTFHACCDPRKSLKQEKEGFLHVDGELSRSERPPMVIVVFAPPKDLGGYRGKLAGCWAGWLRRSGGGCSDE